MAMTYTSIVADMAEWAWDESTQFAGQLSTIMELAQDRCYDAVPELEQLKTSVSGNLVAGSPTLARPAEEPQGVPAKITRLPVVERAVRP